MMKEELKGKLVQFKEVTLQIRQSLEEEEFDNLQSLLELRQSVINQMDELSYTSEEFQVFCNELGIIELQKDIEKTFSEKRTKVLKEMHQFSASKVANKNYNKSFTMDSFFFNKKI